MLRHARLGPRAIVRLALAVVATTVVEPGWRQEQVVYILVGTDAHELEQLDYAVENL